MTVLSWFKYVWRIGRFTKKISFLTRIQGRVSGNIEPKKWSFFCKGHTIDDRSCGKKKQIMRRRFEKFELKDKLETFLELRKILPKI